jgi:hypothetical protein
VVVDVNDRKSPSATVTFLRGRERVLGSTRWLSRDPRQAAFELEVELGVIGARRWLRDVWRAVVRDGDDDGDDA